MGFFDSRNAKNALPPEVAECDAKLNALAQQKQQMIFHIGELFVKANTAESVAGTEYEESFKVLAQNAIDVDFTEKRKLAVQGLRKCDKCGFILSLDSAFCNKCGEKQSELILQAETPQPVAPQAEMPQAQAAQKICPTCGATCMPTVSFCTNCGTKMN